MKFSVRSCSPIPGARTHCLLAIGAWTRAIFCNGRLRARRYSWTMYGIARHNLLLSWTGDIEEGGANGISLEAE